MAGEGVVMLLQQGLTPIDADQTIHALPDELKRGRREEITLDLLAANARALDSRDWNEAARELLAEYRSRVKPILQTRPGYRIAYFGTVSIPLAVLAGHEVGTWRKADIFLQHHGRKDWKWATGSRGRPAPEILTEGLPVNGSPADGELVVRVSTSHRVSAEHTRELVPRPLAEVDIRLVTPDEDALDREEDVRAVATAFKSALDQLRGLYPNAETLHLFAAVPVGLAFLMGTQISPTIHPAIQTYQFQGRVEPKHQPAIRLQNELEPLLVITPEEQEAASRERFVWAEELERLKAFAKRLPDHGIGWLADVMSDESAANFTGHWLALPRLSSLDLCHSLVDLEATNAPGGFRYLPADRKWILADDFLVPLMRRVKDADDRRRAARLFLLHEGLHVWQGLTGWTSPQIGRFAKVLEEIDYLADVWALLYERRLAVEADPVALTDKPMFLRSMIKLAVETMLSFDDVPEPTSAMQVRRVARYLIWSWQYLETERFAPGDDACHVLATKPLIELAGPEVRVREDRVWYLLDPSHTRVAEVALYRLHRLLRFPAGPSSPHEEVLEALRTRQGERMRSALRGVFDQVVRAGAD